MLSRVRVFKVWDELSRSFWFIPLVITLTSVAAGIGLPIAEVWYFDADSTRGLSGALTASSARAILTTLATVMVSVTGIVFSITILTLSIATSQLGPRLIRMFMERRSTQFSLGLFLSTAVYSLLLLPLFSEQVSPWALPMRSMLLALVVGVGSLIYLIFFIHNVALSIQTPHVVALVAADLDRSIERNRPTEGDASNSSSGDQDTMDTDGCTIESSQEGYIQGIDIDHFVAIASELDTTITILFGPGDFVARKVPIARCTSALEVTPMLENRFSAAIAVGGQRTPFQDVECAIAELVEIGVRALSPGVNDPFTALNCIDRLSAAVSTILERPLPSGVGRDESGTVRVVYEVRGYDSVLDAAFHQLGHYGRDSIVILARIAQALGRIADRCENGDARDALMRQCQKLERIGEKFLPNDDQRHDLNELIGVAKQKLS